MTGDRTFEVEGTVDGAACTARWSDGTLVADEELQRRADIVVAIADTFESPVPGGATLTASLDRDITTALLTVVRAFSVVQSVRIDLGSPH